METVNKELVPYSKILSKCHPMKFDYKKKLIYEMQAMLKIKNSEPRTRITRNIPFTLPLAKFIRDDKKKLEIIY